MTRTEHLLVCLMEECSEVAQAASKILRFGEEAYYPGTNTDNVAQLNAELNDLKGVLGMFGNDSVIHIEDLFAIRAKMVKLENCMQISRESGLLE